MLNLRPIVDFKFSMTNSKQYCEHCWERWSPGLHDYCYLEYRLTIRKDKVRIATAQIQHDKRIKDNSTGTIYKTQAEWLAVYKGGDTTSVFTVG